MMITTSESMTSEGTSINGLKNTEISLWN